MPGGRRHDQITIAVALGSSALALYYRQPPEVCAMLAGSCLFSGCFLSCDLDAVSSPLKRWRYLGLMWMWRPYEVLISHRSWVSHSPIVSNLIRWLYLGVGLSLLLIAGAFAFDILKSVLPVLITRLFVSFMYGLGVWNSVAGYLWQLAEDNPLMLIAMWAGSEIGTLAHVIPDRVTTWVKRRT